MTGAGPATTSGRPRGGRIGGETSVDRRDPTYDPWSDLANWRGQAYRCADDPRVIVPKRDQMGWTVNLAWPWRATGVLALAFGVLTAPIAVVVDARGAGGAGLFSFLMLSLGGMFLMAAIVAWLDR
jgi:hypothetical protein